MTLGENCLVSVQRDCNLENKRRNLRWAAFKIGGGGLQICQSSVNGLYVKFDPSKRSQSMRAKAYGSVLLQQQLQNLTWLWGFAKRYIDLTDYLAVKE